MSAGKQLGGCVSAPPPPPPARPAAIEGRRIGTALLLVPRRIAAKVAAPSHATLPACLTPPGATSRHATPTQNAVLRLEELARFNLLPRLADMRGMVKRRRAR